ncbi:761_t:CDS:2, partial [Cetraspora pellucida]
PIMHTDKGKQKEYIPEESKSGDYDEDEADELFDEIKYESEELEEIESFTSDSAPTDNDDTEEVRDEMVEIESLAICLAVMEEIPTKKKALINKKLTVEEQLNEIIKSVKVERKYQESIKELFNKKRALFANGLKELGRTNLVKHMIKTQDAKPIKQPLYRLASNEQDFGTEKEQQIEDKHSVALNGLVLGPRQWLLAVMLFGLSNAPATFQRLMDKILGDFICKFVTVYLDDINIYLQTLLEHINHLNQVFQQISNA